MKFAPQSLAYGNWADHDPASRRSGGIAPRKAAALFERWQHGHLGNHSSITRAMASRIVANESSKWRSGRAIERVVVFLPSGRGGKMLRTFGNDERIAAENDGDVMMPAGKRAPLEVVKTKFLLHMLMHLLTGPSGLDGRYDLFLWRPQNVPGGQLGSKLTTRAVASISQDVTKLHVVLQQAIDFIQRSLAIEESLARLDGQATQLANLGVCYEILGNAPKAIELIQRSLVINERLGRVEAQASGMANLGICYQMLGDIPKAIELIERSLRINQKLGRFEAQADDLANLGICYQTLSEFPKAIDLIERSFDIHHRLGSLAGCSAALGNLGICYFALHDITYAVDLHQKALEIDAQLGNLTGQAKHLGNLGICYQTLGETNAASRCLTRALDLYDKMGIPGSHPDVTLLRRTVQELAPPEPTM